MKQLYSNPTTTNQRKAERKVIEMLKIVQLEGLQRPKDIGVELTLRFDGKSDITTGTALYKHDQKQMIIKLHGKALETYEDFIEDTVVHEFAHIIQFTNFPSAKPHGKTFKKLCRLFGGKQDTTHKYDLKALSPNKIKKFKHIYHCNCMEHEISPLIHGRMLKGQVRSCRNCKSNLVIK